MTLLWRPASQPPEREGVPVVFARRDDDGDFFLTGKLAVWRAGKWVDESTFRPVTPGTFYVTEDALLATLREQV